ncbi:NADH dehydrogenase [ubiquinone] 1 beta subcomplex subunit 10-like [Amphiura filiformis]|uniref:NADH dehydrogenase [ubiquinone] 1 beta subcomplex subunit 10-like n=1 Tax=Amphiura filiformis TaxID=82378 RepID=UPI003B214487
MGVLELFESVWYYTVDGPVTAARNFIENQRAKRPTYYYHKVHRRVTPLEDCRSDDIVCQYEAAEQYKRDKKVEENILKILKERLSKCTVEEGPNAQQNCQDVFNAYDKNADAFEVKYGELGAVSTPLRCMMRQKYRVYYERKRAAQQQETLSE